MNSFKWRWSWEHESRCLQLGLSIDYICLWDCQRGLKQGESKKAVGSSSTSYLKVSVLSRLFIQLRVFRENFKFTALVFREARLNRTYIFRTRFMVKRAN